jgi:hypothetical protein
MKRNNLLPVPQVCKILQDFRRWLAFTIAATNTRDWHNVETERLHQRMVAGFSIPVRLDGVLRNKFKHACAPANAWKRSRWLFGKVPWGITVLLFTWAEHQPSARVGV